MSTESVKSDEQEFLEAYLVSLQNDHKTVIASVEKAEREYDKTISAMMKAKKALGLCYFLRDKVKNNLDAAQDDLARFIEAQTEQEENNVVSGSTQ